MTDRINLPLATSTWDGDERAALQEVIDSDQFSMGPRVRAFEQAFAEFVGAPYSVMVNSGSSANLLAVAAAVINPEIALSAGDEVIVPAVSWSTTYYPLQQYGLHLRFVDIDAHTLNIDLDAVEAAITDRTRAIFAVNLLGNPIDYARLQAIADAHGLLILEDNCEALGARFEGRQAGTFGLMGTYSTFFSHHISTMEGGLIAVHDERTWHTLQSLRAHGWVRNLPHDNSLYSGSGDPFVDLFRFVLPGYNVRPLEMSGALGSTQLAKVPALIEGRRANATVFTDLFSDFASGRIQRETGESSWFGFAITLTGALTDRRADVVKELRIKGVDCRPVVAGNFTRNPVMSFLDATVPDELPAADEVDTNAFFIGNHHYPIARELTQIRELMADLEERFS
ncbi:MAG: DegT/DnrJ/EryC1/StrS family aminotransferase [Demequinaceae bacterium]|nr:DegT/DnrJ/EryC1/StrS family aminotransferase [Demequinaceae bacterium]